MKGYATSDLFIPHPTVKGLWKMYVFLASSLFTSSSLAVHSVGRTDDVIVLSTGEPSIQLSNVFVRLIHHVRVVGEKIVPIPQESLLASSPLVAGVVMFGRERPQPGVLIEPVAGHEVSAGDTAKLIEFRDKIW